MGHPRGMTGKQRLSTAEHESAAPLLRRVRRLTAGLVHHRAPTWSADGRRLAFLIGEGESAHWVVTDRKGRLARVLGGSAEGRASFAPDGSLAYGRSVGATREIWLLPALSGLSDAGAAGTGRRLLGGDGRLYCDPAFSPDGRYLAYVADDGQPGTARRLWTLDLQTEEHRLLVASLPGPDTPSWLAHPAWSPQGSALYFEARTSSGEAVFVLALRSPLQASVGSPRRLTEGGHHHPAPLSDQAVLCERRRADGGGELVLLEHGFAQAKADGDESAGVRQTPLRFDKAGDVFDGRVYDPAVVCGKRGCWLAFASPSQRSEKEPSRSDLFAARVQGLGGLHLLSPKRSQAARSGSRHTGAETP